MPSTIQLNAESVSLILNGTALTDFVVGDIIELVPVNPATSHVLGTRGSVNVNKRADGGVHNLILRTLRYSQTDVFLNNALHQQNPVIFNGSLKEDFTRNGTKSVESWILENGSLTTRPTSKKNVTEGDALMEYTILFRDCTRNI